MPSIKGGAFRRTVEHATQLIADGVITAHQLEVELLPEDRAFLEAVEILPSSWYPAESWSRITELMHRSEKTTEQDLRARGVRAVEGFLGQSAYRPFIQTAERSRHRAGEIMIGLGPLLFNFSEWTFHGSLEDEFTIEITGAEPFPNHFRFTVCGVLEGVAERTAGVKIRVRSERPNPDLILFKGERID